MAAPTYKWAFAYDLMGDRVPKIVTLEATASLDVVEGTLVIQASGQVDEATASVVSILGIAMQTYNSGSAGDPVKVQEGKALVYFEFHSVVLSPRRAFALRGLSSKVTSQ